MAQSLQETELDIAGAKIDVVFNAPVSDALKKFVLQRIGLSAKAIVTVPVLEQLYKEMKGTPIKVDLDGLWEKLGIKATEGQVVFDDSAPLAAVRKAIMAHEARSISGTE